MNFGGWIFLGCRNEKSSLSSYLSAVIRCLRKEWNSLETNYIGLANMCLHYTYKTGGTVGGGYKEERERERDGEGD